MEEAIVNKAKQQSHAEDFYPTRGEREHIIDRVDPVIWGSGASDAPHALDSEQLRTFADNGYLVCSDVFSAEEVAFLRAEFDRVSVSAEVKQREELILEPGCDQPRSLFALHRFSGVFDYLTRDRRILDKVMQILGGDVYLHHSRINIKRAVEGRSFPWHSDFETWHAEDGLPRCRVVSAWVMLTENSEFNGPLYVIPGSHRRFVACIGATPDHHHKDSLRRQQYGVPSPETLEQLIAQGGLVSVTGAPGTLVLHEGNTMHGSPDNITPFPRSNLFFVYNSVHNLPAEVPFAASNFRPPFLAERDFTPLPPVINHFA